MSPSYLRRTVEESTHPPEAASGEGLAAVAGSVPALCQPRTWQRNRGPNFPNSSTRCSSASASSSFLRTSPASTSVLCESPAALAAQLRGCLVSKSGSPAELASPTWTPFRQGKPTACSSLPATPPGTVSFSHCARSSRRPASPSATLWSVLGKNATEPSGQAGHGRPGRWRRECPSSRLCCRCFAPATKPCCPPPPAPVRPHQRCCQVLLFHWQCPFAYTLISRINASNSLTRWARWAQGREAVCLPHKLAVFVGVWEPEVSQPLYRQSPPAPTRQTASRPNPPLRFGASMV